MVKQIEEMISLMKTVKQVSVHVQLFKDLIEQNSDMDFDSVEPSDEDAIREFNRSLGTLSDIIPANISFESFLAEMPNERPYLQGVSTLDELQDCLKRYISDVPMGLYESLKGLSHHELGSGKPYNELPLNEAESFIIRFHEILGDEDDKRYVVEPYDLNYELKVSFESEEEARVFAKSIAPSVLWEYIPENPREIECF